MIRNSSKRTVRLGDLVAAACERASRHAADPSEISLRAAEATVKALLFTGNLRALARLSAAERGLA